MATRATACFELGGKLTLRETHRTASPRLLPLGLGKKLSEADRALTRRIVEDAR